MSTTTETYKWRVDYWKSDKRCAEKCKLVSCNFNTRNEALAFINNLPQIVGDSVDLFNLETSTKESIQLPSEKSIII